MSKNNKRKRKKNSKKNFDYTGIITICVAVCIGVLLLLIYYLLLPLQSQSHVLSSSTGYIIATDNFQRANQAFWGTASDRINIWGGAPTSNVSYSISGYSGVESNANNNTFVGTLGPQQTDEEVYLTAQASAFSSTEFGPVVHETDSSNYYYLVIGSSNLLMKKKVAGTVSTLASTPFTPLPNIIYALRFRIVGTNLYGKVWQSNQPEPTAWTETVSDTSLTGPGYGGIRTTEQSGQIITVTFFQASNPDILPTPTPTITPSPTVTPEPNPSSCMNIPGNLVMDCSFETVNGFPSPWSYHFQLGGAGLITQDSTYRTDGAYSANMTISNGGSVDYAVQLLQGSIPVIAGHLYRIQFDAMSASPKTITVVNQEPNLNLLQDSTFTLGTNFQTYSYSFVSNVTDAQTWLEFNVGLNTIGIHLDNVSMVDMGIPSPTPTPTPSIIMQLATPTPGIIVQGQNTNQQNNSTQILPTDTPAPQSQPVVNTQPHSLFSSIINLIKPQITNEQPSPKPIQVPERNNQNLFEGKISDAPPDLQIEMVTKKPFSFADLLQSIKDFFFKLFEPPARK